MTPVIRRACLAGILIAIHLLLPLHAHAEFRSFAEITSDLSLRQALASLYPDINTIDPLVGALAEDHLPGASVGPLVAAGLRVQFERLRDADRFWYENDPDFIPADLDLLRNTRLSDIIMRNTDLTNLQPNVFSVPEPSTSFILFVLLVTLVCARSKGQRDESLSE